MKPKQCFSAVALVCLLAVTARASSLTLNLDQIFSTFATSAPSSPTQPWLTATFTDNGVNNVLLTMAAVNLSTNTARVNSSKTAPSDTLQESVFAWWFNINPLLSAQGAKLNFTFLGGVPTLLVNGVPTVKGSVQDGLQDPTGRLYDFKFVFGDATTPSSFTNGLNSKWNLTGVGQTIHASDFVNFFDTPDGAYESAANIKNTVNLAGRNGPLFDNAVIGAVPEPATWFLVGTMAVPVWIRFSRRPKP